MSQVDIDAQKRRMVNDIKNRYQMVFFPPAPQLDTEPVKETRQQKDMKRIDKLLNVEVSQALTSQAALMSQVLKH